MFEPGVDSEGQSIAKEIAEDICYCPKCSNDLVQPVEWFEVDEHYWQVSLECPNCWNKDAVILHDEIVDAYALIRERGAVFMARSLHDMVEERIEDEVGRLHEALESGLLLPEDF